MCKPVLSKSIQQTDECYMRYLIVLNLSEPVLIVLLVLHLISSQDA